MNDFSPQKYLEDFRRDVFLEENDDLLESVYERLFQEFAKKVKINKEFKADIKNVLAFFNYLKKIKSKNHLKFSKKNKKEIIEKFANLIDPRRVKEAAESINEIVKYLSEKRKNINGLQIFCWAFFNETTREEIVEKYLDNLMAIEGALMSFEFLGLFIESKNFLDIAVGDFLIDLELKDPSRRKGNFDKILFKKIFDEIKEEMPLFEHNIENNLDKDEYWLIDETVTKKINFPLSSENSKLVDVVCRVGNNLIIGSHKEQNTTGGAQDNQTNDVGAIFNYGENNLNAIKKRFNVERIFLCIVLQAKVKNIESKYWKSIFERINNKENEREYLLNGFQFKKMVKDLYSNRGM